MRRQRAEMRGRGTVGPVPAPVKCHYCKRPATGMYTGLLMCEMCRDQITVLDAWYAEEPKMLAARAARFTAVAKFVRRWLWVPNLAFVGGAMLYLGWQFGQAVIEWIEQGGMQ